MASQLQALVAFKSRVNEKIKDNGSTDNTRTKGVDHKQIEWDIIDSIAELKELIDGGGVSFNPSDLAGDGGDPEVYLPSYFQNGNLVSKYSDIILGIIGSVDTDGLPLQLGSDGLPILPYELITSYLNDTFLNGPGVTNYRPVTLQGEHWYVNVAGLGGGGSDFDIETVLGGTDDDFYPVELDGAGKLGIAKLPVLDYIPAYNDYAASAGVDYSQASRLIVAENSVFMPAEKRIQFGDDIGYDNYGYIAAQSDNAFRPTLYGNWDAIGEFFAVSVDGTKSLRVSNAGIVANVPSGSGYLGKFMALIPTGSGGYYVEARDIPASGGSTIYKNTYTATGGQTVFTLTHSITTALVVSVAGVIAGPSDYSASGTTLTLTSGAASGEVVQIVYV